MAPKFMSTRQVIATAKASLAYTLAFILIFIHSFSRLNPYPVTLSGVILICIAGQPGLAVGACWYQALFAAIGVGLGGGAFAILAKLGGSRVAQGFVLAIFVYLAALVKAQSLRYFGMSLLFIILAFSGAYTSVLSGGRFVPEYLEAYLAAYCWGFAIVLVLLVLPHSAEKELREILVISLEHISTFSHLIGKTYLVELTDEERVARDELNQSIRSDMGVLGQRYAQAGIEINYTRWTMHDYGFMVAKVRAMQHGLITSYSSLVSMEKFDPAALEIVKQELQDTHASKAFSKLRRSADLAFSDIVSELAVGKADGKVVYHSPAPGERHWEDFHEVPETPDLESGTGRGRRFSLSVPNPSSKEESDALQQRIAARLRKEVMTAGSTPTTSRRPSMSTAPDTLVEGDVASAASAALAGHKDGKKDGKVVDKVAFLRGAWRSFEDSQLSGIGRMLATGVPEEDELRLSRPGPSMAEQYANPPQRINFKPQATSTATHTQATPDLAKRPTKGTDSSSEDEKVPESSTSPSRPTDTVRTAEMICASAVMRSFAFLAGMGAVGGELATLYEYIVPQPGTTPRKKAIRFHLFESKRSPKPAKDASSKMSVREALARLSGRDFVAPKKSIWTRIAELERLARTPDSIYAAKTAAAVSVYAVFLLAPSLQSYFVDYGLTSGIITIVVALAPTLGQSLLTFVIQILGTGFGSLLGLLILRIFLDVGGYKFNPYGMVCLLAVASFPLSAIIYTRPQFFAGALLALNGAGVLIVTEWTYNEVPGQIRPGFDSPAYRCAKQFVAMCMALSIAAVFQILILRQPARQTLRQKLARISWQLNGLGVLLSYLTEAVMPMVQDSTDCAPPDWDVVRVVQKELIGREVEIQGELLGLMPIMKFASVEPTFGQPFKAPVIARIIRSHQLILDRLREARTALGEEGFSPEIRKNFSDVLVPYRKQAKRVTRALSYFVATSLSTKQPLPPDLPSMIGVSRMLQHDAMVLSRRLTRTEEGRRILASSVYLRYWFFISSMASVSYILEGMESDLRELFGDQIFSARSLYP
ncbi:uncharacterized protein RHOBADRAFT_49163 [Rhodotorula graminis WP1]|uniref:Uncharacterized protein n=1 Tax=Rhodotorula graminis (strain WP1) TaxID=578459 RepID=A0A194SFL7_RHOGW|nr:uncharacterized protein RHOBADRAFT_49163 [Rhodotorula graminis WP1]KPV78386.1 hypothetical protein RHOBADRAFT_49163 [Rhodotorula graminis WP1]